jgi:hypothetical protein
MQMGAVPHLLIQHVENSPLSEELSEGPYLNHYTVALRDVGGFYQCFQPSFEFQGPASPRAGVELPSSGPGPHACGPPPNALVLSAWSTTK